MTLPEAVGYLWLEVYLNQTVPPELDPDIEEAIPAEARVHQRSGLLDARRTLGRLRDLKGTARGDPSLSYLPKPLSGFLDD